MANFIYSKKIIKCVVIVLFFSLSLNAQKAKKVKTEPTTSEIKTT